MIRLRNLFISPGHNFVGHHGQPPGTHPLIEVPEAECVAGRGIRGDRYFDRAENHKGQITFFAWEVFADFQRALALPPDVSPGLTRRNVITIGADLPSLVGREFEIQGLRFEGVEECRPCYWMNHAFARDDAERLLHGRGGLRARILVGGLLHRDA